MVRYKEMYRKRHGAERHFFLFLSCNMFYRKCRGSCCNLSAFHVKLYHKLYGIFVIIWNAGGLGEKDIGEVMDSLIYDRDEKIEELKRFQDKFHGITGLFLCCLNGSGKLLSEMSGAAKDVEFLRREIGEERFKELYRDLLGSQVEDQIVERAQTPGVFLAAQAIKVAQKPALVWIAVGVIKEEALSFPADFSCFVTEAEMYGFLDFLMETSKKIVKTEISRMKAETESARSRFSEHEMSESLKRLAVTTEIVQYLESEDAVEKVLYDILKTAAGFLEVDSAQVFQVHKKTMDVVAEWLAEGKVSLFEKSHNIERLPLLRGNKLLVISSDTKVDEYEQKILDAAYVKGIMIFPISINGNGADMYVCFNQCARERVWSVWDVKLAGNAAKIMQSILIRRVQKNSLASSYAVLESVLDNAGSAIFVKDSNGGSLLFANKVLKKLFEKELEDGSFDSLIKGGPTGNKISDSYEMYEKNRKAWYDVYRTEIRWVDGRAVVLYVLYDITDKKIYQKKIEQQAYTDFLTGLYNRMCCERDLAWQIDECKRKGEQGALLYLDLDDFKHINDGLGHQYGDALLKAISHSLQRIEGINNTCYRMGGDEFVIIVPPERFYRLEQTIGEIKSIFNNPWFLKDADYYCTMSMGVVTFPEEGESVQELIKKADIAMYEAKKSGKNQLARYNEDLQSTSGKRLDMEKNMRAAAINNYREFAVYYQPIIDVEKGCTCCCGAEALLRWNNESMGYIPPSEFIPLAEYLGLINPIGNHVLMEACKACKKWIDSGYPYYKVNVNLSVVQLLQTDIVEIVQRAITVNQIPPQSLTLEVTENLAINDVERMKGILNRIRSLGVRIALDDFGTGYSSLNHIREIPLDVIKIDQSFVKDLAKSPYPRAFIRMVADLARAIGVNVCVEGIETKEQYEALMDVQINLMQGYYFDRPMPQEAFEEKYVKERGRV